MQSTSLKRSHSTSFDFVEDKDSKKLKYEDKLNKSGGPDMFSGAYLIQKYSGSNNFSSPPPSKQNDLYRYA